MKKTTNNNETITVKVFSNAIAENIGIWDYSNTKKYSNWIGRMTDKDGKVEYFKKSYDEDLYFYLPKDIKAGDILKAGCTMVYKKRSESAYYAVIEVTEDSITLLEETTYLKATKAYNDYVENMAAEEEEEEYATDGANDTVVFSINNNTIKNTEDYYNILEVMIGKNRWQPLNKKNDAYDITGISVGDILREGGIDSKGKTWITNYYIVTRIENNTIVMVEGSSVKDLNRTIELYGLDKLAELNNNNDNNNESDKNKTTMRKKEYIKQLDNNYLERIAKELSEKNNIDIELFDDGMDDSMICVRIKSYFGYITVNEDYNSLSNDDYLTLGIMINADADDDEEEMKHIWQLSALAEEENNLYYWTTIEEAAEAMIDIIRRNS